MTFWDRFLEQLRSLGETLVDWAILIAVALVILIVGRWVLKWVRRLVQRVLGANWLDGVWERSGVKQALANTQHTPASIAATVIYAYLMIGLWLIIARVVGLHTIEGLLERLLLWVPQLILASVVVLIAAAAANWVAELVRPFAANRNVPWLTVVVRIAVIVFGVMFALEILDITFAEDVVKLAIAAVAVAFAIAFGVGGIDTAKLWWSKYGRPKNQPPGPG